MWTISICLTYESSDSDVPDHVQGINTDAKYYECRRNDDSHVKKTLVGGGACITQLTN